MLNSWVFTGCLRSNHNLYWQGKQVAVRQLETWIIDLSCIVNYWSDKLYEIYCILSENIEGFPIGVPMGDP